MPTPSDELNKVTDVPVYYTNSVNVTVSSYDFVLSFGQTFGVMGGPPVTRPLARLMMSPQHAKVLSEILAQNVKGYEETFGPLTSRADLDAMGAQLAEAARRTAEK